MLSEMELLKRFKRNEKISREEILETFEALKEILSNNGMDEKIAAYTAFGTLMRIAREGE